MHNLARTEEDLDDQRWAQHRKMIGLSEKTQHVHKKVTSQKSKIVEYIKFVEGNFKRKECRYYMYNPHSNSSLPKPCHCGAALEQHHYLDTTTKAKHWSYNNFIHELPTNAFGEIDFYENTRKTTLSKYVRLADNTDMELIGRLLTEHWRIMEDRRPSLIISVVGGAKNFKLGGSRKENLNNGLIKTAKSTNAWFITSGTNMGCMKVVGDAVNKNQYIVTNSTKSIQRSKKWLPQTRSKKLSRGLRCIGIVPWGYVEGKEVLVCNPSEDECNNGIHRAQYNSNTAIRHHHPVPLNPDHTHFLLVDDGLRGKYTGTKDFRARFHRYLCDTSGFGIPLVLIVMEGGIECIKEVHHSLTEKIPVVVVEGTGRAADILAYAFNATQTMPLGKRMIKKCHLTRIDEMLKEAYSKQMEDTEFLEKMNGVIQECCSMENLMTVFNIDDHREKLDVAILLALLKGGISSTVDDQLHLAIKWDRSDIAEKIFLENDEILFEDVNGLVTEALLNNQVEFLKLFLQNGVSLQDYLTVKQLRSIYNTSAADDHHILQLLTHKSSTRGKQFYLRDVHALLEDLMKIHKEPNYENDSPSDIVLKPDLETNKFKKPATELFLWAILNKRMVVADFFWERSAQPIRDAIVAVCLLEALFNTVDPHETMLRNTYKQYKTHFEKIAVDVMKVCASVDQSKAVGVIERKIQRWGYASIIEMAHQAVALSFTATSTTRTAMNWAWKRGMKDLTGPKLFLAFFFPLVLFTNMYRFLPLGDDRGEMSALQKLRTFYKAPVTKFFGNCISFLLFLSLYSYTALFNFRYHMTVTEIIVFFWICVLFIDEVREILQQRSKTLVGKFSDYISSAWNKFDVASLSLAFVAQGLRMFETTFSWGRIMYAINTAVFYTRTFRMYHAHYGLGPKLITLYRMINELGFFVLLLLVCILGYGIASHALLHPYQSPSFQSVVEIMSLPYWQMYGELSLDQVKGDNITCTQRTEYCEHPQQYEWVVLAMLAVFMLVGNVLLLNLLIAVFTYVFDEVHENCMEIWKYEMLRLVQEYDSRPWMINPLVVFEDLYMMFNVIFNKCCRKDNEEMSQYLKESLYYLTIFEKECSNIYLSKKEAETASFTEERVKRIEEKLEEIVQLKKHESEDVSMSPIEEDDDCIGLNVLRRSPSVSQSVMTTVDAYTPLGALDPVTRAPSVVFDTYTLSRKQSQDPPYERTILSRLDQMENCILNLQASIDKLTQQHDLEQKKQQK